ncbi:hypothetical protein FB451DRAFT_1097804 [Mycena latifolia]|nr:hypothetical protein FB451DRAFT_1097804 [Mycena latifolia]
MKFAAITATLALLTDLVVSKECSDGACVSLYRGSNCQLAGRLLDYVPTCAGNCFQYSSFDSVDVNGDVFLGTDCHIFSDKNCKNQITDTGNVVGNKCVNTAGAQSMICYYGC